MRKRQYGMKETSDIEFFDKDVSKGINQLERIQGKGKMGKREKEKLERVRVRSFIELLDAFYKRKRSGSDKE